MSCISAFLTVGVNYRKVLTPESSFPAPLLDALAGWDYLKDLGFEAKNITFIGESAGAHLCLLLARYLGDIGAEGPGALALSGPWCDMSPGSHNRKSMTTNYGIDYIPWLGKLSAQSAGQHYTLEARNGPYFAPAKATVEEWKFLRNTKVFVHAGAAEILIDEIRATVETMKAAGVQVTYVEVSTNPCHLTSRKSTACTSHPQCSRSSLPPRAGTSSKLLLSVSSRVCSWNLYDVRLCGATLLLFCPTKDCTRKVSL